MFPLSELAENWHADEFGYRDSKIGLFRMQNFSAHWVARWTQLGLKHFLWQRDGFYRIEKGTCKTFHFSRWSGAAVLNSENTEIFEAWSKSFSWHCMLLYSVSNSKYYLDQLLSLQISMKYYFCIMGHSNLKRNVPEVFQIILQQ